MYTIIERCLQGRTLASRYGNSNKSFFSTVYCVFTIYILFFLVSVSHKRFDRCASTDQKLDAPLQRLHLIFIAILSIHILVYFI